MTVAIAVEVRAYLERQRDFGRARALLESLHAWRLPVGAGPGQANATVSWRLTLPATTSQVIDLGAPALSDALERVVTMVGAKAMLLVVEPGSGGPVLLEPHTTEGFADWCNGQGGVRVPAGGMALFAAPQAAGWSIEPGGDDSLRLTNTSATHAATVTLLVVGVTQDASAALLPGRPGQPVASSIAQTTVTLTWTAATGPNGVAGYRVYAYGELVWSGAGLTANLSNLTPGGSYRFEVAAYDSLGVEGPVSSPAFVTMLPVVLPPPPDPDPDPGTDNVPPPAPTTVSVAGALTLAQVVVSEVTDPSGIAYYSITADGQEVERLVPADFFAGFGTRTLFNLTPGRTYLFAATATDVYGNTSEPRLANPYTVPVATAWGSAALGAPAIAGSVVEAGGNVTVTAAGADIWGSADQGHFAFRECTGDFRMVARLDSFENTDEWAKAGVMFRETLSASSRYAFMLATPTAVRGAAFQARTTTGGASGPTNSGDASTALPRWLRIERVGNIFTGYTSTDGTSWTPKGSVTIDMPSNVYCGLAVTSHNVADAAVAVFSNVSAVAMPLDLSPPTVPGSLAGQALGSDRIALTWAASTDTQSGVAGYRLYRNASPTPIVVAGTSFEDSGRQPGTTYTYRVSAVDQAGNESTQSSPVSVTTPALNAQTPYQSVPIPPFTCQRGTPREDVINLDDHFVSPAGQVLVYSRQDADTLPAGVTYTFSGATSNTLTRTYDGSGSGADDATIVIRATEQEAVAPPPTDWQADWQARTTGDGFIATEDFSRFSTNDQLYAAGAYATRPPRDQGDCRIYTGDADGPPMEPGEQCLEIVTFDTASQNGGNWTLRPAGTTRINDFYVQFQIALNRALLKWVRSGIGDGGKLFIIGEYGGGQVALFTPKNLGFPGLFLNGGPVMARYLTLPWATSGQGEVFYQPSIYTGAVDYTASKERSNQVLGPSRLIEADSRFDYGYKAAGSSVSNFLDERGFPFPNPDALASGAVAWTERVWLCVQIKYRQDAAGAGMVKAWMGPPTAPPKKTHDLGGPNGPGTIQDGSGGPLTVGSNGNPGGINVLEWLTYPTGAIAEPGYRPTLRQFVKQAIVRDRWIPWPNGHQNTEPA
jgi:chitodextrinase